MLLKNKKKGLNFHKNRNSVLKIKEKIYVFQKKSRNLSFRIFILMKTALQDQDFQPAVQ